MDHRIGLFLLQQRQQPVIILAHGKALDADVVTRQFPPGAHTLAQGADRGQRSHLQFDINLAARQVVDDDDLVAARRKVQRRRPAAEAVATQDDDFHDNAFDILACAKTLLGTTKNKSRARIRRGRRIAGVSTLGQLHVVQMNFKRLFQFVVIAEPAVFQHGACLAGLAQHIQRM